MGVLLLAPLGGAALHYQQPPCSPDEVQGEVQGASGYLCAPNCDSSYGCPSDPPSGTTAQAQCMLQDVSQKALCGLVCKADAECPSGARCTQLTQMQVGLCIYPMSFADWARQGNSQKLAVGWPSKPGAQSGSTLAAQLAKTSAALQNLKSRYSIGDSDMDMAVLKALVSSMQSAPVAPAAAGPLAPVAARPQAPGQDSVLPHDLQQVEKYMSQGVVSGLEQSVHDTVWNVEHIERQMAATNLLTGLFWVCVLYLGVGGFFKYQQGARGYDLIPHAGFWSEYPALVNDGVKYSKILLGLTPTDDGVLSGGIAHMPARSGSGSFDPL